MLNNNKKKSKKDAQVEQDAQKRRKLAASPEMRHSLSE